jgi:dephospho-CoA kinase
MALRVGLTGGIGSGKSTVLAMLAQLGAATVDADAISRATTAAGGAAIAEIERVFGAQFITAERALDRDRMRAHTFSNAQARKQLEAIIHPLVGAESAKQVEAALARGTKCVVFDIPLLVESGRWRQQVDRVLVIDCSPETQVARVMQRSGLDADAVRAIIATQATRAQRLAAADIVICNEHLSLEHLAAEVRQAARSLGVFQTL